MSIGHSKTPTEFLYLETGLTPLKDIVASRRIMYLHNVLNRDKEELVKRIYETKSVKKPAILRPWLVPSECPRVTVVGFRPWL